MILDVWPWWKEFHSFWRELPNYNPIAVETSEPGVDHATAAAALFEPSHSDQEGDVTSPGFGATPLESPRPEDMALDPEEGAENEHDEAGHSNPVDVMLEAAEVSKVYT